MSEACVNEWPWQKHRDHEWSRWAMRTKRSCRSLSKRVLTLSVLFSSLSLSAIYLVFINISFEILIFLMFFTFFFLFSYKIYSTIIILFSFRYIYWYQQPYWLVISILNRHKIVSITSKRDLIKKKRNFFKIEIK